ncbi:hypothetical protein BURC_00770 [Burkholderiaceae bacterium]|nr:hypothetical protein BURC_00770 [Burkholderiaceae bacterium]
MNYDIFIRLLAPYHAVLVHFPVAIWTTVTMVVVLRAFSDGVLARAAERILPLLVLLGVLSGLAAFVAGFFIFSLTAAGASPLIRNHIIAASWSLGYWTVFLISIWRIGTRTWEGTNRWIMLALALLGTLFITVTGTVGGHIAGNPTSVSMMLKMVGWDVYDTFFVPDAMLWAIVAGAVVLPIIGWIGRSRA